ncbi:MAG: SH3 domain-containing protein [Candidatus Schmidhempelia sp.]|nr:SH3 domain-containing protein [Candidatus Schmidhempelia sp.]
MNKYLFPTLLISFILHSTAVIAVEKYISDDLSTYLRRGPGNNYGLSGSLNAGDKVEVLSVSQDGKFSQIQDKRGRVAWLETTALSDTPSLRHRIPELEQQISNLKKEISNLNESHDTVSTNYQNKLTKSAEIINSLQTENQQLQARVTSQQTEIETLSNELDEKRQRLILNYFLNGGLVAGGGLLLGLILPVILPRRRKKDIWMN